MLNLKNLMLIGGLSAAVAGGGLTGCAARQARESGRLPAQVVTDNATDNRVKDALHNSPVYKFPGIGVQTFDGVVQLYGFVETSNQKNAADEIARRVPGVQRVVNDIEVRTQVAPTGRSNDQYRAPIYESNPQRVQPEQNNGSSNNENPSNNQNYQNNQNPPPQNQNNQGSQQ